MMVQGRPRSGDRPSDRPETGRAGRPRAARKRPGSARRRPVLTVRARIVFGCVAVIAVLGGAWLWVRDSPLVAVDRVDVTGATGPDAAQIRQALVAAGRTMTTLDVRMSALQSAVAPFSIVGRLRVSARFPHALRIRVLEEVPVGEVQYDGETVAVAADGRLLRDGVADGSLPMIPLATPPSGTRLTDRDALRALALLAAAPTQLLAHVGEVSTIAPHGLVAQLRSGPAIYFGDLTDLQTKWMAASEVLADPGSVGAAYIDVTDPQRPAAGSGAGIGGGSATGTIGDSGPATTAVAGADSSTTSAAQAAPATTTGSSADPATAAGAGTGAGAAVAAGGASGAGSGAP